MKRVIGALICFALLLGLVTPVQAHHLDKDLVRVVRWTGCKAQVFTSDEYHAAQSFYDYDKHALYIGTSNTPAVHLLMIVLHESGHCLQAQIGYLIPLYNAGGSIAVELDADRIATDLACGAGLDGPSMLRNLFAWARATYGYEGDDNHGTMEQRIAQAENALVCRLTRAPKESPVAR